MPMQYTLQELEDIVIELRAKLEKLQAQVDSYARDKDAGSVKAQP